MNEITKFIDWIEKKYRPGLIPRMVDIHRKNKIYRAIRWTRPEGHMIDIKDLQGKSSIELNTIYNKISQEKTEISQFQSRLEQYRVMAMILSERAKKINDPEKQKYYTEYINRCNDRIEATKKHLSGLDDSLSTTDEEKMSRVEIKDKKVSVTIGELFATSKKAKDIPIIGCNEAQKISIQKRLKILPQHHLGQVSSIEIGVDPYWRARREMVHGSCGLLTGKIFFNFFKVPSSTYADPKTVIHEVGHAVHAKLWGRGNIDSDLKRFFRETEKVKKIAKLISCDKKYATTSPMEFFVETYGAYVRRSEKLEVIWPEIYEYFKAKVFGGIEYKKKVKK